MGRLKDFSGRVLAILLSLVMVITGIAFIPVAEVNAAGPTYDPAAAVKYAYSHYETSSEWCAGFVSQCLMKGGGYDMKLKRFPGQLGKEIVNKKGFTRYTLNVAKDGNVYQSSNKGIVVPGDVIVWYCGSNAHKKDGGGYAHWLHAAIVTKISNNKVLVTQTHHPLKDHGPIAKIRSDCFDGHRSSQIIYCYHYTGKIENKPEPPAVSQSNISGGKKVTLSAGSGTTIKYNLDNKGVSTYNGAFNITAPGSHTLSYFAEKNNLTSDTKTTNIYLPQTAKPEIKVSYSGKNATVSIYDSSPGAVIYYSTGGSYAAYSKPVTLTASAKVEAYAQGPGYGKSAVASANVLLDKPAVPTVRLITGATASYHDAAMISWNDSGNADSYNVTVKRGSEIVQEYEVVGDTATSIYPDKPGEYSVSVEAVNQFGRTAGEPVSFRAMADVKATIVFDEETGDREEYVVPYGGSLEKPKVPAKEGHDFEGWDGVFTNLTEDTVITARYQKKTYAVVFKDSDGTQISRQVVGWHEAASAPDMSGNAELGFAFAGWAVDSSSDCSDYTCVDGNMILTATYKWAQPEFPVIITNLSASSAPGSSETGQYYTAIMDLTASPDSDLVGRVIVQVSTSGGTTVVVGTKDVTLAKGTTNTVTVEVAAAADGTVASAYVVGLDSNRKTAGALSEEAVCDVTRDVFYSDWSEWSEVNPSDLPEGAIVEKKTEYRYKTRSTATSTTSRTMAGYTLYKTDTTTGSWSKWQDSAVSSVNTDALKRDVEIQKVPVSYNYAHYCTGSVSGAEYQTASTNNTTNSTFNKKCTYHSIGTFSVGDSQIKDATDGRGGYFYFKSGSSTKYKCSNTCYRWYRVATNNKTQYKFRDTTYKYYFEKISDWSDWSESKPTTYHEIDERTLYRYRTVLSTGEVNETENDEITVAGVLPASDDLSGTVATVLVYKQTNTDPTETQMEYVGQTVLGEGNRFSFRMRAREELSDKTGDFIVALALEGGERLINASVIPAPSATYNVTFMANGEVIEVQHVEGGKSASAPAAPEIEGMDFERWDTSSSCITEDTIITAVYKMKSCAVVYVDPANNTVEMTHADYGTIIDREAPEAPEGFEFTGWSEDVVTGDMVVNAKYAKKVYNVVFTDAAGEEIASQEVEYGDAAALPDYSGLTAPEGMKIVGWDPDAGWWNIDSDKVISPEAVFDETVETPTLEVDLALEEVDETEDGSYIATLTTQTPGAMIYFTLDGSDPTPNTDEAGESTALLYSEPFKVSSSGEIRAIAVTEGMNNSDTAILEYDMTEYEYMGEPVSAPGKDANTMIAKAKAKTRTVKYRKLKKKKQTITASKAFAVSNAVGAVTYKKVSGSKKITVAPNGKITIKKGLKKGKYKLKVTITAAGDETVLAASKTITIKIKVK